MENVIKLNEMNCNTTETNIKSGSRFGLVFKKMWIEQRRTLMMMILGYIGAWVALGLWIGYLGGRPNDFAFAIYCLTSLLCCSIVASKMFFDMTRKEGRIALLMTPATPADKFWVRMIAVVPGMIALAIAGYYAFALSMKLSFGLTVHFWPDIYNPLRMFTGDHNALGYTTLIAYFMFNEALFIFGSIAWPRKSFLKTIGVYVAINLLLSTIMIWINSMNLHWSVEVHDLDALLWIFTGIVLTIDTILIWGAYRKLCMANVIK